MPPKIRGKRVRHPSATADNAHPGSATSMDVILRWLTTAGNVKRWRTEIRGPLCREIVDALLAVDIKHRDVQFVRYKVDAIEKKYIAAKQWLLETGMHDAFMRSKATKEVKAHVEHLCPPFRMLDPAFRGVPFTKKNAKTIELDADSAESVEEEEKKAMESDDEVSSEIGEEESDGEEDSVPRDTMLTHIAKQSGAGEERKKAAVEKEITGKPRAQQQKFKDILSSAAKVAMDAVAAESSPAAPKKRKGRPPKSAAVVARNGAEDAATQNSASERKTREVASGKGTTRVEKVTAQRGTAATRTAYKEPAAVNSSANNQNDQEESNGAARSTSGAGMQTNANEQNVQDEKEESKRTSSSAKTTAKRSLAGGRKAYEKEAMSAKGTANGQEQLTKKGSAGKQKVSIQKSTTSKRPTNEERQTAKQNNTGKRKSPDEESTSVEATADGAHEIAKESNAVEQKAHEEELISAKRARIEEEMDAERKLVREIERKALLKRVEDEEQQRQEMYAFERAKLKCELEAKQVQVLYEKATARKKLDQLGLSQEEIDLILPL
ncbi:hypothetical protein KRP22_000076 [Phytophthora ramorum]|nr:hypothetical protein KRP22_12022 [Phytophthora ramorum]